MLYAEDYVYMERRPAAGIWGGLWSFPELDGDDDAADWCREHHNYASMKLDEWETVRHSFTHFDLDIAPIVVRVNQGSRTVNDSDTHMWYSLDAPPKVGLAAPVADLLNKLKA